MIELAILASTEDITGYIFHLVDKMGTSYHFLESIYCSPSGGDGTAYCNSSDGLV